MDTEQTATHPFQRLTLPHRPPPPAGPSALRPPEEPTPIFDQLLRDWRAGALRPTVSRPVDDRGKPRASSAEGSGPA